MDVWRPGSFDDEDANTIGDAGRRPGTGNDDRGVGADAAGGRLHAGTEEAALKQVFGVDSQLIGDGTYFVVEALEVTDGGKPVITGCGGWSKRKTLYGGDQFSQREDTPLDPAHDAAKIRAFFVHPAWARRGIGSKILSTCENSARKAGFTRFEMGATLTGVKLFSAKGYTPVKRIQISLGEGESLPVIQMEKRV